MIRVSRLILIPTERIEPPTQRNLVLSATEGDINNLKNMFDRTGVTSNNTINPIEMAKAAPSIMSLSSTANARTNIVNGWGTQRFKFIMVVEVPMGVVKQLAYIQGYSEHGEISYNNNVDDNMELYINSVTLFTQQVDPMTNQVVTTPDTSFNLLYSHTDNSAPSHSANPHDSLKLARSTDIINGIKDLENGEAGVSYDINTVYDSTLKESNRRNAAPIDNVTKTLNSLIKGRSMVTGYDDNEVYHNAKSTESEVSSTTSLFIGALTRLRQEARSKSFTINNLMSLDPSLRAARTDGKRVIVTNPDARKVSLRENGNSFAMLDSQNYVNSNSVSISTNMANTITHYASGFLTENLLARIVFRCINQGNQPKLALVDWGFFIEGLDETLYLNRFKYKFEEIVMRELTKNNLLQLDVTVECELVSDTKIVISVEGSQPEVHYFPTFADSLYSPVITNSYDQSDLIKTMAVLHDATFDKPGGIGSGYGGIEHSFDNNNFGPSSMSHDIGITGSSMTVEENNGSGFGPSAMMGPSNIILPGNK